MGTVSLLKSSCLSIVCPAGIILLLTAGSCVAEDARFSLSLEVVGRELHLIGHNSLGHDLICEYAISLRMGKLRPEDRPPPHAQPMKGPQGLSLEVLDENASGVGGQGALLPKGSVNHVLNEWVFQAEIIAANLTEYGCRMKETMPRIEKDQSRHPPTPPSAWK